MSTLKMQERILRYVADIEIPEGIVSIDCEVRSGGKTEILFILNNSTYKEGKNTGTGGFRSHLENHGEMLVKTKADDTETFIRKTLFAAYGPLADITLTDTDTD